MSLIRKFSNWKRNSGRGRVQKPRDLTDERDRQKAMARVLLHFTRNTIQEVKALRPYELRDKKNQILSNYGENFDFALDQLKKQYESYKMKLTEEGFGSSTRVNDSELDVIGHSREIPTYHVFPDILESYAILKRYKKEFISV